MLRIPFVPGLAPLEHVQDENLEPQIDQTA